MWSCDVAFFCNCKFWKCTENKGVVYSKNISCFAGAWLSADKVYDVLRLRRHGYPQTWPLLLKPHPKELYYYSPQAKPFFVIDLHPNHGWRLSQPTMTCFQWAYSNSCVSLIHMIHSEIDKTFQTAQLYVLITSIHRFGSNSHNITPLEPFSARTLQSSARHFLQFLVFVFFPLDFFSSFRGHNTSHRPIHPSLMLPSPRTAALPLLLIFYWTHIHSVFNFITFTLPDLHTFLVFEESSLRAHNTLIPCDQNYAFVAEEVFWSSHDCLFALIKQYRSVALFQQTVRLFLVILNETKLDRNSNLTREPLVFAATSFAPHYSKCSLQQFKQSVSSLAKSY